MLGGKEARWKGQRQVNKDLIDACSVPSVWADEARLAESLPSSGLELKSIRTSV